MNTNGQGPAPLADRIASALRDEAPSEEIAALIAGAEQARAAADEERDAAHAARSTRPRDPKLPPALSARPMTCGSRSSDSKPRSMP